MKSCALPLALVLVLPALALAGHEFPVPTPIATPSTAAGALSVWPYTTSDFSDPHAPIPADPVNLVFLDTDPRAIRQSLMSLSGARGAPFPPAPPFNCEWSDAMGYEQAAWGEPEGWVGGAIQLACYTKGGHPLGDPFRYHLRLFRIGEHTLGAAHFEILIPGTPEHEVLSWRAARDFVVADLQRAGAALSAIPAVPLFTPTAGSFRAVRRAVYDALAGSPPAPNPAWAILAYAGLPLPPDAPANGDIPLPADGMALVVAPGLVADREQYDLTTTLPAVPYDITLPKPFCNFENQEYVKIKGTLEFRLRVKVNPSGQYLRTYELGGVLSVTALTGPDAPGTFDALVTERHRAILGDQRQEVTEVASQSLLRDPPQVLGWALAVGLQDRYFKQTVCGFD